MCVIDAKVPRQTLVALIDQSAPIVLMLRLACRQPCTRRPFRRRLSLHRTGDGEGDARTAAHRTIVHLTASGTAKGTIVSRTDHDCRVVGGNT